MIVLPCQCTLERPLPYQNLSSHHQPASPLLEWKTNSNVSNVIKSIPCRALYILCLCEGEGVKEAPLLPQLLDSGISWEDDSPQVLQLWLPAQGAASNHQLGWDQHLQTGRLTIYLCLSANFCVVFMPNSVTLKNWRSDTAWCMDHCPTIMSFNNRYNDETMTFLIL